jgi:tRNA-2-methylthio-N6-dimethylallyladenosine synthase
VLSPRGLYFVKTYGCQMNLHDSERIAGLLEEAGYLPAPKEQEADLVVFNTCCIRENADNKLYGSVATLKPSKAANPKMRIAVGGCLAQKDGATIIERSPHLDVVFGTHNVSRLVHLLDRREREGAPVCEILDGPSEDTDRVETYSLPARRERSYSAWVTISVGCDNTCTFCIVPKVRGPERSRHPSEIVAEVEALADAGVVEVTLLGQNVNSYGRDLRLNGHKPLFADLLRRIDAIDGVRRIRFTSPHPKDLRPETIEAMAECPKVMPHLHLPLQSGSDRILRAMHRGYTAERYLEKLEKARSAIYDLAVTTDIIVGFPGETEDDFEDTLEVVRKARYDGAYMFIYSPRPGTAAAELDYDIDAETLQERFQRLVALVEELSHDSHRRRIGLQEEILVEGPARKGRGRLFGRTPQNKVANFDPPTSGAHPELKPGTFVRAKIVDAGPHHLDASLVEICP